MNEAPSLGRILQSTVLAALLAGAMTAGFHSLATEPVIDDAIALEEAHAVPVVGAEAEPVVSRPTQKLGLVLGYGLYAVTVALLFGVAYHLGRRLAPVGSEPLRGIWLAATAYFCLGLLPMLKYPSSPPGMGDPATMDARQAMYLTLLGLAVLVGAASLLATRFTGQHGTAGLAAAVAVLLGGGLLLFAALPSNTDEITVPAELLTRFRVMSLLGVTLFWTVFAAGFAWLISQKRQQRRSTSPALA